MVILPRRVFRWVVLVVFCVLAWEVFGYTETDEDIHALFPAERSTLESPQEPVSLTDEKQVADRIVPETALVEQLDFPIQEEIEAVASPGRVILVDDAHGAALANTRVEILWSSGRSPFKLHDEAAVWGWTDSQGCLEVPHQEFKGRWVILRAPGFGAAFGSRWAIAKRHAKPPKARLRARGTLELRIEPELGVGLSGSRVAVRTSSLKGFVGGDWFTYSEEFEVPTSGVLLIEDPPLGKSLKIVWLRNGFAPRTLHPSPRLRPGDDLIVPWSFARGVQVSGRLLDQFGEPISGMPIVFAECPEGPGQESWILGATRQKQVFLTPETDQQGAFACGGVVPGGWMIGPEGSVGSKPGDPLGVACSRDWFQVSSGMPPLDLKGYRGLFIRGRITAEHELPNRILLIAQTRGGEEFYHTNPTPEDGAREVDFVLGPLSQRPVELCVDVDLCDALNHAYVEAASKRAGRNTTRRQSIWHRFADSAVTLASAGEQGVEVRIRTAGTLEIQTHPSVLNEILSLDIHPPSEMWNRNHEQRTEADGGIVVGQLTPGPCRFIVSTADGWCGISELLNVYEGVDHGLLSMPLERGAVLRFITEWGTSNFRCKIHFAGVEIERIANAYVPIKPVTVPRGEVRVEWRDADGVARERILHVAAEGEIEIKL